MNAAFTNATNALRRVYALQQRRHEARQRGDFTGQIDADLAAARTNACGAILAAAPIARAEGCHDFAEFLADEYELQERAALAAR